MVDFHEQKIIHKGTKTVTSPTPHYIYSITETRLTLSKEFKEIFMAVYKAGESPRKILENQKYGEFHQDYRPRGTADTHSVSADTSPVSEADEIRQLRHE